MAEIIALQDQCIAENEPGVAIPGKVMHERALHPPYYSCLVLVSPCQR